MNWEQLATRLDKRDLPAADVVEAILDTFGLSAVVELTEKLAHPGAVCLALAEAIAAGKAPDSHGDALDWASRAADCGLPPGSTSRLIAIGVNVDKVEVHPIQKARECLLDLTREVLELDVTEDEALQVVIQRHRAYEGLNGYGRIVLALRLEQYFRERCRRQQLAKEQ